MALPAGRYGVTKNQLLKIKKLPMNTIKLIEELTEKFDLLGSAAFKNSTSVVTNSSDLVESGAVKNIIGWGNKNLFYSPYNTKTSGGYTAVKNNDGTFTVNGIDTAQSRVLVIGTFTFKAGITYMMSGCPTGISDQIYLRASSNDYTIQKIDNGSGVEISFDTDTTLNIQIRCGVNQTANNLVFSPMIELGDTKTSYEPYHESVEQTLRDAEVVQGKNLLPNNATSQTLNSVTFTVNDDDGSITANNTATANTYYTICRNLSIKKGTIINGCPSGGSADGFSLVVASNDGTTTYAIDTGEGAEINNDVTNAWVFIRVRNAVAVSNKVFYPMISADGGAYEPYYIPLKDIVPNKCDNSVIGTVEDGTNPTKAYAVDEFMVRDGAFCQVTAPVNTSSTWTEGSNYTKKSIAEVLQSLMS